MKAGDKQMIAVYGHQAKVPKAEGKRRVSLVWTLGKGGKKCDEDALNLCIDGPLMLYRSGDTISHTN